MTFEFRGLKLKEGDKVKVQITENVKHEGYLIIHDAALCLEFEFRGAKRKNPLTNYAPKCKIEKI